MIYGTIVIRIRFKTVYVCEYVRVFAFKYVNIYIYIYVCMSMCVCISAYMNVCVYEIRIARIWKHLI